MMYQHITGHISTLDGQSFKVDVPSFKIYFVVTMGDGISGPTIRPEEGFLAGRLPFQRQGNVFNGTARLVPWKILSKESLDLMEMRWRHDLLVILKTDGLETCACDYSKNHLDS